MKRPSIRQGAVALAGLGIVLATGAFSCQALTQPLNDAPVKAQNTAPADIGNMPDGFSNFASKCDHGNRVYSQFKDAGQAMAVVPQDPTCKGVG